MKRYLRKSKGMLSLIGYFLITIIYCVSIAVGTISLTVLENTILQIFLICALSLILLRIITYNKYTAIGAAALLAAAASLLFLYYLYGESSADFFEGINEHITNISELIYGRKGDSIYHLAVVAALCVAIAFYTTIFTKVFFCFPALLIPGLVVFVADLFFRKFNSPLIFFGFVFCMAALYAVRAESKWKLRKSQKNLFGKYALSVFPFCLAAVLLAAFASTSFSEESFITQAKLKEQSINTLNQARELFFPQNPDSEQLAIFNFNSTGFNPNSSRLGGNISFDNTEIFTVNVNSEHEPSKIYLKGSTNDNYTGTAWTNSDGTFEPYLDGKEVLEIDYSNPYSYLENIISSKRDQKKIEEDEFDYLWGSTSTVDIWPINKSFSTLFYPSKSSINTYINLYTQSAVTAEINDNGDIRINPAIAVGGEHYSSSYYNEIYEESYNQAYIGYFKDHEDEVIDSEIYLSEEEIITTEMYCYDSYYEEFEAYEYYTDDNCTVILDYAKIGEEGAQDFYTYLDELYEKYTALPDSLPERVSELAYSITEEYETDYEKLKAMEKYLRAIPYSVSPGTVPAGNDFVDYFLFESGEGYCTYYASAMCVMARALGYPSRFVQGYVTPETDSDQASVTVGSGHATYHDESGNVFFEKEYDSYYVEYSITNAQAHAWPEIYLEGLGWVQFEPTAPYASMLYDDGIGFTATTDMEDDDSFQKHLEDMGIAGAGIDYKSPNPIIGEIDINTAVIIMLTIVLVLLVMVSGFVILRYRRKGNYLASLKKSDNYNESIKGFYNEIFALLALDGHKRLPYETPLHFSERISENYNDIIDLNESTDIYYKACYSRIQLSPNDRSKISTGFRDLSRHMEQKLGKYKYHINYWIKKIKKP